MNMNCPKCGYMMSEFDGSCTKCHGQGLPQSSALPSKRINNRKNASPAAVGCTAIFIGSFVVTFMSLGLEILDIESRPLMIVAFLLSMIFLFCLMLGLIAPKSFSWLFHAKATRSNISVIFGLLFMGFAGIGAAVDPSYDLSPSPSSGSPTSSGVNQKPVVVNDSWDGSVRQVKVFLRENLHDPWSIKYVKWYPVIEALPKISLLPNI